MDVILIPFLAVLSSLIGIYIWVVIASAIISWLISFKVINSHNNFVLMISNFLYRVTEPVLAKIRRFLPLMGGLDFSPLVLIVFLWFLREVIGQIMMKIIMVGSVYHH